MNRNLRRLIAFVTTSLLAGTSVPGLVQGAQPAAGPTAKPLFHVSGAAGVPLATQALRMGGTLPEVKPENDKVAIRIAEAALGKEFLLQAAITTFAETPSFKGVRSRVVQFKKHRGKLYLLESAAGHTVTTDLPTTLLLAEFPIVEEHDGLIEVDWNAGMHQVFLAHEWHASDFMGQEHDSGMKAIPARFSFVDGAAVEKNGTQIVVRQVAQLQVPPDPKQPDAETNPTVEIKYYLSLYEPDPTFQPSTWRDRERMGFFEVAPQLQQDGGTVVRASKFHPNKPIVFAISANTPADYKQAVKEGILYWNRVFGEEKVKVVDAPAGVVPPDYNLNIVQWISWDEAHMAYADAQMDPRTGEILHAQIYLPSSFATGSRVALRNLAARTRLAGGGEPAPTPKAVTLGGFASLNLCGLTIDQMAARSAAGVAATLVPDLSDAQLHKASQDIVRAVVAHEVGHTLGLRHNFAGSLAGTLPRQELDGAFQAYLQGKPTGKVPSTTVMDYLEFRDQLLLGDFIGRSKEALQYDKQAIAVLYKGARIGPEQLPPFCTDSAKGKYLDCDAFDGGSSFVSTAVGNVSLKSEQVAHLVLEAVISATKTPPRGREPLGVERLDADPQMLARMILMERHLLMRALTDKGAFLAVRRNYPNVGRLNDEEVRQAELQWLTKELEKAGGLQKAFAPLPQDYTDRVLAHWNQLLTDKKRTSGVGRDGKKWELSDAEIAKLQGFGKKLFGALKKSLAIEDVLILAGVATKGARLADHELSRDLAIELEKRAAEYLMATEEGNDIVIPLEGPAAKFFFEEVSGAVGGAELTPGAKLPGIGSPASPGPKAPTPGLNPQPAQPRTLTLPRYKYPIEVRLAATQLLAPGRSEAVEWGLAERSRLKAKFGQAFQAALAGKPIEGLKLETAPRLLVRWIIEQKRILAALDG